MNYLRIIFVSCMLLHSFHAGAVRTILSGHIKNDPKETLSVQYYASPLDRIESTHTRLETTVDYNGNFKLVMDIDKPVDINVMNGESYLFINKFIGAGDSLFIEFDKDQITINGRGDNGISGMFELENRVLNPERSAMQNTFRTMTDIEFAKYWSEWVDSGLAFYNRYYTANPASITYIKTVEKELKYEAAGNMVQYGGGRGKLANDSVFRNPTYMQYLGRFVVSDTNALATGNYLFFLGELSKYFAEPMGSRNPIQVDYYKRMRMGDSVAKIYFSGPVYDAALYTILYGVVKNVIRNKGTDGFSNAYAKTDTLINDLCTGFNDKKYAGRIKEKLAATKEADKPADDFTATDLNGKPVKLSDFKGKVVYVDFWSTSCVPCVAEIPHMKELHEKYKDKDVVFLCVAFDRSKAFLEEFLKKKEFPGRHTMAPKGFSSDPAMKYHISSIPRYLVIDKKGNLVSSDAPRPSLHPESVLDNALAQE